MARSRYVTNSLEPGGLSGSPHLRRLQRTPELYATPPLTGMPVPLRAGQSDFPPPAPEPRPKGLPARLGETCAAQSAATGALRRYLRSNGGSRWLGTGAGTVAWIHPQSGALTASRPPAQQEPCAGAQEHLLLVRLGDRIDGGGELGFVLVGRQQPHLLTIARAPLLPTVGLQQGFRTIHLVDERARVAP